MIEEQRQRRSGALLSDNDRATVAPLAIFLEYTYSNVTVNVSSDERESVEGKRGREWKRARVAARMSSGPRSIVLCSECCRSKYSSSSPIAWGTGVFLARNTPCNI